jgi:hypothetical protein
MKTFITITVIAATTLGVCFAAAAAVPDPLVIPNKMVGGVEFNQYTPGVVGGVGLHNIGLLIQTSGRVVVDSTNTTDKYFYINDGSNLDDTSGFIGLRVSYANLATGKSITPPADNVYVVITGISSTTDLSGRIIPTLRPREQSDIAPAL